MKTQPGKSANRNETKRNDLILVPSDGEPRALFSFYQKCWVNTGFTKKVTDMLILLLLLLVLTYRLVSIIHFFTFPCFLAFLCESCFTFTWFLCLCTRWTPALVTTCPGRLLQRVSEMELPAVDMFVTTADPVLEPPIITVNTVLSLLALDYPSHKLACYVSDDGCSPLTFHALVEACKFAQLWVPFCKKHHVQLRAPLRYFSHYKTLTGAESPEFKQEWLRMKDEYEDLRRRIEQGPAQLDGDLADFSNTERRNHPAIIKVIWENKKITSDGLPHLIYISREKRPKYPHHYKAGAMNTLARVSGLMTNAPYTLNLDCDMSVNNPMIALHAMCILLDPKSQKEVAFVQCPQHFCGALKDDPFGNQMVVLFKYMGGGLGGIQGSFYAGTNAFHRRKVLYGNTSDEELAQIFGGSKELVKSVALTFKDKTYSPNLNVSKSLEEAHQVASCGYEYGSGWGKQVGWMYGSMTEDVLTGLTIHTKGWRSEMCTPDPTAFSGCAPECGPGSLTQQKRWGIGLLEILFTKHCPILGIIFGKLQFREAMAYLWITTWAARSVPELCYAILPVYCIITNSTFFPRGQGIWIHVALFVVYNIHTLSEYIATGLSLRAWWNNQRMSRIVAMTAWPFSVLSVILKLLGTSDTVFEVTQKDQSSSSDDEDAGRFTFNTSPMFIPGTTVLLLQLIALATKLSRLQPAAQGGDGSGVGELFCVSYIILCYRPFLKGLFDKGKYGIPLSTVFKSAGLSFVFVLLCRRYH
ncbi:cellulose synthase-like protein H1 [Neltuma alba]|uniref:cellulose synthase-like protein H1 n=1 Tax=Neltuma alba TaxID=207710 RepID=UPI0010A4D536|nr:cellulose synthase-like protein H1 [Prosopis alba]